MAVIVEDMNMPTDCIVCEFGKMIDNYHVYCIRHPLEPCIEIGSKIPKHCPLKEVFEEV